MVNKWTPGKWRVESWSDTEAQVVSKLNGNKSLICAGVMPADASLIAAAPDLYKALEAVLRDIGAEKSFGFQDLDDIYTKARTALARARGEVQ